MSGNDQPTHLLVVGGGPAGYAGAFHAAGRTRTLGRREGLTKLVVDPRMRQVLGVGMVGPDAGELIGEGTLAVELGARIDDLGLTVHAHPTLSETMMEAAEQFFDASTHFVGKVRSRHR